MNTPIMFLRKTAFAALFSTVLFTSCSKSESEPDTSTSDSEFQVAMASGTGSISGTYLQGLKDLSSGEISFSNKGYSLQSSRTSHTGASSDGKFIYALNFTVGTIEKLQFNGGDNYTSLGTFDGSIPLGSKTIRFRKLDDTEGSLHIITTTAEYNGTEYLKHKMILGVGILNFETMNFGTRFNKNLELTLPGTLGSEGYFISRIDAPVRLGNKLFYGAAVSKFNKTTGKNDATDKTFTVVVDYPGLTTASVIINNNVKGANNGYRKPTQYVNENQEIYQLVSDGKALDIVKIKTDGTYDDSYRYNISQLLGKNASANGWFYVGDGIGYVPYEKVDEDKVPAGVNPQGETTYSSPWGVARVDLKNNTIVDLEVPKQLWLRDYQSSVVKDGKFYITLAPVGGQGNIYIYDVKSTSPKGTLGAKITAGADQYYIGIF